MSSDILFKFKGVGLGGVDWLPAEPTSVSVAKDVDTIISQLDTSLVSSANLKVVANNDFGATTQNLDIQIAPSEQDTSCASYAIVSSGAFAPELDLSASVGSYLDIDTVESFYTKTTTGTTFGIKFATIKDNVLYGANSDNIYTSTDGLTWATVGPHPVYSTTQEFKYLGNRFIVVGPYISASSTDAITWTSFNTTAGRGVDYGNGRWTIATGDGIGRTSTDAITWTTISMSVGTSFPAYGSPAIVNGTWVHISSNAKWSTSTDGYTWVTQTQYGMGLNQVNIMFSTNGYLFVGEWGTTAYSTDATTWATTSVGSAYNYGWHYFNNKWWALAGEWYSYATRLYASTDIITWTSQASLGNAGYYDARVGTVVDANSRFIFGESKSFKAPIAYDGNVYIVANSDTSCNVTVTPIAVNSK